MQRKILFLTLNVFSVTGGIEKVARVAGKALCSLAEESAASVQVYSMYDKQGDVLPQYIPADSFRGFGGARVAFVTEAVKWGRQADLVLLSHLNLLTIGYAIKKLSPKTKLVLMAHGIEVWAPLPAWKVAMLKACDRVLAVSRFTADKVRQLYGLKEDNVRVLNNCLDPFLAPAVQGGKSERLLQRYGLTRENKVLFTLTRLSSAERYKGYDEVIMALKALQAEDASLKYLVVGKYDGEEKARLDRLVRQQGLTGSVIFAGFIPDNELADHFNLADVYIMPSRGEGFGIVFVEALYYGLPVIAGNRDGSADAVLNGKLGRLVNPTDTREIVHGIQAVLGAGNEYKPEREAVLAAFGYSAYQQKLHEAISPFLQQPAMKKQIRLAHEINV